MSISLTRLAWSMWGGRGKEKKPVSSKASALNSKQSSEWGLAKETKMGPPHRKVGRNKEERRVDREYDDDVVLVPCDNDCNCDCCLSGSESDDSDWSIGWLEPLASDFRSNGDDGFAVLVPCYKPSCCKVVEEASNKALLGVIKNLSNEFSSGWLNMDAPNSVITSLGHKDEVELINITTITYSNLHES
ncbi:hypothetical protein HKD37_08G023228 [Glycine soja]